MTIEEIAAILKAKKISGGYRAKCPAHNDKHPSLWFSNVVTASNPKGILRFECKAGCHYSDIRRAIGISGKIDVNHLPQPEERDVLGEIVRKKKIKLAWEKSLPIEKGSPVWKYLVCTRNLFFNLEELTSPFSIPYCLRYDPEHPIYEFDDDGKPILVGKYPAMIARLDNSAGELTTIHRTYLTQEGTKAEIYSTLDPSVKLPNKKLMASPVAGCTDGGAIRLFKPTPDGVLGIAEGIETALACATLFNVPTWAAWSATGLAKFIPPLNVKHLIIFADNDKAGRQYAGELNRTLNTKRLDLEVRILFPERQDEDWADHLLRTWNEVMYAPPQTHQIGNQKLTRIIAEHE